MKVVIFCGGKGTRLREETQFRPKPMVPIGQRPILWHIMKLYAHYGHNEFVLCLGYKGEIIQDFFRNYLWRMSDVTLRLGRQPLINFHKEGDAEEDWTVTLAETGEETMTARRLKTIQHYIGADETFLLTYGDGVGDVHIPSVIAEHQRNGALMTVTAVHPPGRFGDLNLNQDDRVIGFDEKPQAEGGWINGGFFAVSRRIFDYLEGIDDVMLERGPLAELAGKGELAAYRHDAFWQPMDTYQEFLYLNRLWAENRAPWKVW